MSAKERFLKKLQDVQPHTETYSNKGQADLAAFRQRVEQLRESATNWLTGTEIGLTEGSCTMTEMLISNAAFTISCFSLHFQNREVKFTPLFLYGQGVTGCVEVTLNTGEHTSRLARLFMRSAESLEWSYILVKRSGGLRKVFNEESFFAVIEPLLP
ncbi:hypothetical protein TUM12370_16450 [Salmonella enterica subsp. enterica serovar Choleraesuis]|nr:hypothetical protein TUM12370_16450 [Salmonella enterica subsp. enterica serovar Choleraesuis]